jgi:Flp pilus assembly pilin Flp
MREVLKRLLVSEDGQGFMEYALIAALVVVGAIVAFKGLGGGIKSKINNVNTELGNAQPE